MPANLGSAVLNLDVDDTGITVGSTHAVRAFSTTLRGAGIEIGNAGRQIVGFVANTVGAFASFESAFAGVLKTVEASPAQFDALRQGIRDMSKDIPTSSADLAHIMEIAGQMGVTGVSDLLLFTKTVAQMAVTTNLTADEAADAFGRIALLAGVPINEVHGLGSAIVDLGNKFVGTESDIVGATVRMAGLRSVAHVSIADILGLAQGFVSVGVSSEVAGSVSTRTFLEMGNAIHEGGTKLAIMSQLAGVTTDQFKEMQKTNPALLFAQMARGISEAAAQGADVKELMKAIDLGTVRAEVALPKLGQAFDTVTKAIADARTAKQEDTALTVEADKRYSTLTSQMQIFVNVLSDLNVELGAALAPTVRGFIDLTKPWVEDVRELVKAHPELARAVLLTAGAVGVMAVVVGGLTVAMAVLGAVSLPLTVLALVIIGITAGVAALVATFPGAGDIMVSTFRSATRAAGELYKSVNDLVGIVPQLAVAGVVALAGLAFLLPGGILTLGILTIIGLVGGLAISFGLANSNMASTGEIAALQFKIAWLDAIQQILQAMSDLWVKTERKFIKGTVQFFTGGLAKGGSVADLFGATADSPDNIFKGIGIDFAGEVSRSKHLLKELQEIKANDTAAALQFLAANPIQGPPLPSGFGVSGIPGMPDLGGLQEEIAALGGASEKTKTVVDALSDGVIDLGEANDLGLSVMQAALLETVSGEDKAAQAAFRNQVELVKLSIVLGDMTPEAFKTALALKAIQDNLNETNRSLEQWNLEEVLMPQLQQLSQALSDLFSRPTRQGAEMQLTLAQLERDRDRRKAAGASDEELKGIDRRIQQQRDELKVRQDDIEIMKLQAILADNTLITDEELRTQFQLLITDVEKTSGEVVALQGVVFFQVLAAINAGNAANELADSLRDATSRVANIPVHGSGGIAMSPHLAVVGDIPEAIIPLSQLDQYGGGSGGNIFHIHIMSNEMHGDAVAGFAALAEQAVLRGV